VPTVFASPSALLDAVGTDLGVTDWLTIEQGRVDRFAEATGDHQWIHTDPERAKGGPFGGTIAHGYLTLSLVNHFLPQLIEVHGIAMGINYGTDRVRFPAPVPVGSRVRAAAVLAGADEVPGGVQARVTVTVEVEGQDKPACVVETLSRFVAA
jgi:acyl dehydratase